MSREMFKVFPISGPSRLSSAIAAALLISGPALANSAVSPSAVDIISAVESAFDPALDRSASFARIHQSKFRSIDLKQPGLNFPLSSIPESARQVVMAERDPVPSFIRADGSRTDDLEAAAASWREGAEFNGNWGLQAIGAEYAYARGITGAGVSIGMLDTGVDDRNSEFAGNGKLRLLNTRESIRVADSPYPREVGGFDGRPLFGYSGYSDHGTHVGGIMVANRDGIGMHGVAYGALLHSATHYLVSDGITGFRGKQYKAASPAISALVASGSRFVNHSWGSGFAVDRPGPRASVAEIESSYPEELKEEYAELFGRGDVIHVFAAGNSGGEFHPGPEASLPVVAPHLESRFVNVVNITSAGVPDDSSQLCGATRFWCVSAPGTDINSTEINATLPSVYEELRRNIIAGDNVKFSSDFIIKSAADFMSNYVYAVKDTRFGSKFQLEIGRSPLGKERALVGDMFTRLAEISGLLHHLDIEKVASGNRDILELIRDNPSELIRYISFRLSRESYYSRLNIKLNLERIASAQDFIYSQMATADYMPAYGKKTGTSMAAPHVTGALALVAERFNYMDNVQVRDTLLTTSTDLGEEGVDITYGWGKVDLKAAMQGPGAFLRDFDVTLPHGLIDTWSNNVTNGLLYTGRGQDRGALVKRGSGSLILSGDNSFDGFSLHDGQLVLSGLNAFGEGFDGVVEGGELLLRGTLRGNTLRVNGGAAGITDTGHLDGANLIVSGDDEHAKVASVHFNGRQTAGTTRVGARGFLSGNGVLGSTIVAGAIAPGNSIGTLTINGNYTQLTGSRFLVELAPPGQNDLLDVTGTATLKGGTVVASRAPGNYQLGERYRFLSAAYGISGEFDALDTTAISPFLRLMLNYEPTSVSLDVSRGRSFASAGSTYNQTSTAAAVDALPDSDQLVRTLAQVFPGQATSAFDLLSGDVHATSQSVLVDGSRHVRNTMLSRSRGAREAFSGQYEDDERVGTWVALQRTGGRIQSDGNAAGVEYSGGSTLMGADYTFSNNLRLGVIGGVGKDDLKFATRDNAKTEHRSGHAGLFASHGWGGFGVRAGVAWASHDVKTQRRIAYPGFADATRAHYDAQTFQGFVEAGYRLGNERWGIEPYVQLARVKVEVDAFQESGGASALAGNDATLDAELTTAGMRFDTNLKGSTQAQTWLSLHGGVGFRKAGGELAPRADLALGKGRAFAIQGAPVASDATLLDLGVSARTSVNSLLELTYNGQFASAARDHGASLRWSIQF